jgi:hypothetical protein
MGAAGAIGKPFKWAFEKVLEGFYWAIAKLIDTLLIGITERLLYFPNPAAQGNYPGLNTLYDNMMINVFFPSLSIMLLSFLIAYMFFPYSPDIDIYRFAQRAFVAIFLVLVGPMMFYYIFELYTAIGHQIIPETYKFTTFRTQGLIGAVGGVFATFAIMLYVGTSIIISLITMWIMLAMRMLIISTTFALFPFLMALWIPDVGPLKYANGFAEMVFKITAVLLLLGFVVSGFLAAGDAIASDTSQADVDQGGGTGHFAAKENQSQSENTSFNFGDESNVERTGEFANSDGGGGLMGILFPIFAYFGAIWASILSITMVMGMMAGGGLMSGGSKGAAKAGEDAAADEDGGLADDGPTPLREKAANAGGGIRSYSGKAMKKVGDIAGNEPVESVGETVENTSVSESVGGTVKDSLAEKHRDLKFGDSGNVHATTDDDGFTQSNGRSNWNKAYSMAAGGANRLKNAGKVFGSAVVEDDPKKSFGKITDGIRNSDLLDKDKNPADQEDVENPDGRYGRHSTEVPEEGYDDEGTLEEEWEEEIEESPDDEYRVSPEQGDVYDEGWTNDRGELKEDLSEAYEEGGYYGNDSAESNSDSSETRGGTGSTASGSGSSRSKASSSGKKGDSKSGSGGRGRSSGHPKKSFSEAQQELKKDPEQTTDRMDLDDSMTFHADRRTGDQVEGREKKFEDSPWEGQEDEFGMEEMPTQTYNDEGEQEWNMMQIGHAERGGESARMVNFYDPRSGEGQRMNDGESYEVDGVGVREYPNDSTTTSHGQTQRTIHSDARSADYNQMRVDQYSDVNATSGKSKGK